MASKRKQDNSGTSNRALKVARKANAEKSENDTDTDTETETEARPLVNPFIVNVILRKVFKKLDIYDKFNLRLVSRGWCFELEAILQLTRTLNLNLICNNTDEEEDERTNTWNPFRSFQSVQFDSNCTQPKLKSYRKANLALQERHFNEAFVDTLLRLFGGVSTLVVYLDCDENPQIFANLLSLIGRIQRLASFSLIRYKKFNDMNFLPQLCRTLDVHKPLDRIGLYVHNDIGEYRRGPVPDIAIPMSLPTLQHLALPYVMGQANQQAILDNVGAGLALPGVRQGVRAHLKLSSLCIPLHTNDLVGNATRINLAQVFGANGEMHNIQRLQLTRIADGFASVREVRQLCPELEALHLFDCDRNMAIDTETIIEIINEYDHLSDVALFGNCLTTYVEGQSAPRVRKLAVGGVDWFINFKGLIELRDVRERVRLMHERQQREEQQRLQGIEPAPAPVPARRRKRRQVLYGDPRRRAAQRRPPTFFGDWKVRVVEEFVKLINHKFPQLEHLTVVSHEGTLSHKQCTWTYIVEQLIAQLKSDQLKVVHIDIRKVTLTPPLP